MKKRSLFAVLILSALLMQYCKKSSTADDTTTTPPAVFGASINDIVWTPTTVNAVLTYNSVSKTKIFTCTATGPADQVYLYLKQPSLKADSGFAIRSFNVDSTANFVPVYSSLVNNVFIPLGTVNSGSIAITAIDSVKKVITGTFNYIANKPNYDGSGNIISVTSTAVTGGSFNSMPYTFVSAVR